MFEKIIERKIKEETELAGSIQKFNSSDIESSHLPEFTKVFIIIEKPEGGFRADLEELIEKSVRLSLNFTLRPKWTILQYVFGSYDSAPVGQVNRKLNIFEFYKFYEEAISSFIKESGILVITKKKVIELIDDTNCLLYEKLMTEPSAVKTKNFFLQIFKLIYDETTDINLDTTIPFGFIRLFLEDKSFTEILEKFYSLRRLSDDKEINLKTIIKIINGKYLSEEELTVSPEPAEVTRDELPDIEFVPSKSEIGTEEYQKEAEEPEPEKNEISLADSEVFALFKSNKITKFQKKIFGGQQEKMLEVIRQMDNIGRWDDAAGVLKELFEKNNVDIYDGDVVYFVNTINDYFNRKEGN